MMLVDDEPIILRGLKETIEWAEYGIEIAATARDGEEAIEAIGSDPSIQIIVTDVKMPNKDGLQLTAYLHTKHPDKKVIMLSGYDEFEYAQKAMQLGVKHYLLKPVDVDELIQVVTAIASDIKSEEIKSAQYMKTGLENAIYHYVLGNPKTDTFPEDEWGKLSIYPFISSIRNDDLSLAALLLKEDSYLKYQWKKAVEQQVEEKGFSSISVFIGKNSLLTCLFDYPEKSEFPQSLLPLAEEQKGEISFQLQYGLHNKSVHLPHLSEAVKDMNEGLDSFPIQDEPYLLSTAKRELQWKPGECPTDLEKKLISAVFTGGEEDVQTAIRKLFHCFRTEHFLIADVIETSSRILIQLRERYREVAGKRQIDLPFQVKKSLDEQVYNTYSIIRDLFEKDIKQVVWMLEEKRTAGKDGIIDKAEQYIHSYYASSIKAQEVADVINVTPNYFSTLFKQKTGKTFNEYVNELRIEKAKTLLKETPFKVSDIAEQVGYHEYKYFVEVFKKMTGLTPTKYRKWTSSQ